MSQRLIQPGFFLVSGVLALILGVGTLLAQTTSTPTWCGEVKDLLDGHCTACHNAETPLGGVDLSCYRAVCKSENTLVEAGEPEAGTLVEVLTQPGAESDGPDHTALLDESDYATLRAWIEAGCPLRKRDE
jgi:hypothetical protein